MKDFVCILDYQSGNVGSVYNQITFLSKNVKISNETKDLEGSSHIVLPGVGAFGPSMRKIEEKNPLGDLGEAGNKVGKTLFKVYVWECRFLLILVMNLESMKDWAGFQVQWTLSTQVKGSSLCRTRLE